ncbi:MAG: FHA domain-containing protein [Deltaproteobacteria bacterium]|nr:FHA domain-containing protein [Deltaproteobacteria bacterium]
MLKLIIEDDDKQVKVVRLLRDEITIGRKEGNTIRLTERNVSRRHAKLFKKEGQIYLEDLGSYNGVKYNGKKISEPCLVNEGDRINIGDYMLMLKVEAQAETDPFEEMATVPVEKVDFNDFEGLSVPSSDVKTEPAEIEETDTDLIPADQQAGLVVITSNFAGTSFKITRKTSVIGRTPENDIPLDHKSISRNHAQIEFDGSNYSITDMQSANGVRINGEQYDKMSLRKGDTIDLGHVRFRFVAPGEDYVFTPEVAVSQKSGRNNSIIIAVVLVLVFGIVFVVVGSKFLGSSKKDSSDTQQNSSTVSVYNDVKKNLDKYTKDKKWAAALNEVDSALKREGISDDDRIKLKKIRTSIGEESKNEKALETARSFQKIKAWDSVYTEAKKVTPKSVYSSSAAQLISKAKTEFLSQALISSKEALKNKACGSIEKILLKAKSMEYTEAELSTLSSYSTKCSKSGSTDIKISMKTTTVAKDDKNNSSDKSDNSSNNSMKVEKTTKPAESYESLMASAKAAYPSNCPTVVSKARKAYRIKPSALAVKYVGLCGCKNKRRGWSKWAYGRSSGGMKKLLFKLCKKNGINL